MENNEVQLTYFLRPTLFLRKTNGLQVLSTNVLPSRLCAVVKLQTILVTNNHLFYKWTQTTKNQTQQYFCHDFVDTVDFKISQIHVQSMFTQCLAEMLLPCGAAVSTTHVKDEQQWWGTA